MNEFEKKLGHGTISGKQSEAHQRGEMEGRIMFLEELLKSDDSYENWLDLDREINNSQFGKDFPEFKIRLTDIINQSKWQQWAEKMKQRDNESADMLLKMQKETGITDMHQLEQLLVLWQFDRDKFLVTYASLINKN